MNVLVYIVHYLSLLSSLCFNKIKLVKKNWLSYQYIGEYYEHFSILFSEIHKVIMSVSITLSTNIYRTSVENQIPLQVLGPQEQTQ